MHKCKMLRELCCSCFIHWGWMKGRRLVCVRWDYWEIFSAISITSCSQLPANNLSELISVWGKWDETEQTWEKWQQINHKPQRLYSRSSQPFIKKEINWFHHIQHAVCLNITTCPFESKFIVVRVFFPHHKLWSFYCHSFVCHFIFCFKIIWFHWIWGNVI